MGSWNKTYSYGNVLQVSSVKPDKYGKCIKFKVNTSEIIIDKDQAKKLVQYLIEKYL